LRLLKHKRYKVITNQQTAGGLIGVPIKQGARVRTAPEAQGMKTFQAFDNELDWYYPLVACLYVHEQSGKAVILDRSGIHMACNVFENYLTIMDNMTTVVLPEELRAHPVLSNGYICQSPEEGAYIQNRIRQKVLQHFNDDGDFLGDKDRKDFSIDGTIDHYLMDWYAMHFDYKLK
jgi:hypothetical protein